MTYILNIETSTKNCSVSISKDDELLSLVEEVSLNYSHSERLHSYIEEALKQASISLDKIDAISVSKGPGSYTGLRIGVSTAKGLCFALNKPLISIETLEVLANKVEVNDGYIIPLLDARRMEVYSAVYNEDYKLVREIEAEIIDENSFEEFGNSSLYLIGDGAKKCEEVLKEENFNFITDTYPSAKEMVELSFSKYKKSDFEDVAYFEPYYLKDFVVTPQKKKL